MDGRRQRRGFCREMDSWLLGPTKSLDWVGAHWLIGCGPRVFSDFPALGVVLMPLRLWNEGGYRKFPIKSYSEIEVFPDNSCI